MVQEVVEAIILKGIYYLKSLSEYNCNGHESMVLKLSEGLDKLLKKKGDCEFGFVCIAIKASIPLLKGQKLLPKIPHNRHVQSYYEYFNESFRFWITQRNKFASIDETNYFKDVPVFLKERETSLLKNKANTPVPVGWLNNFW